MTVIGIVKGKMSRRGMANIHCSVLAMLSIPVAYAKQCAVQLRSELAVVKPQRWE